MKRKRTRSAKVMGPCGPEQRLTPWVVFRPDGWAKVFPTAQDAEHEAADHPEWMIGEA